MGKETGEIFNFGLLNFSTGLWVSHFCVLNANLYVCLGSNKEEK